MAIAYIVTQYEPDGIPTGASILVPHTELFTDPISTAVDSNGNVYVEFNNGKVYKYNSAGVFQYAVVTQNTLDLAVDPTTNDLYLLQREYPNTEVSEYTETGINIAAWQVNGRPESIAVNGHNGTVYVGETAGFGEGGHGEVLIYKPGIREPCPNRLRTRRQTFCLWGGE